MTPNSKKQSRLRLNRETFRRLTTQELNMVDGGRYSSDPENLDLCSCSRVEYDSSLSGQFDPAKCNGQQP